ncbi:MAG: hypothetical protein KIY12_07335 [Thermoplasmata archaeon]|uniref:DZANK-type domain-containing protein n=1 Tax=Candidatus Sysuiplasma superficiale TaxID=2823368 RepID=A0A8J8CDN0_9ARCH|nr:hypothetical protein [Candidatus Sysuiplasma superficiale]MBX8644515.1 hypothetical protein [Candidatus Sysuiplasma superficiale]MCL5437560.1 hypothetical protein [Candidatus Thermoplasmatota archaeon]
MYAPSLRKPANASDHSGRGKDLAEAFGWGLISVTPLNIFIFLYYYVFLGIGSPEMMLYSAYLLSASLSVTIIGMVLVIEKHAFLQASRIKSSAVRKRANICTVCGALVASDRVECPVCSSKLLKTCISCNLIMNVGESRCPRCHRPV